MGTTSKTNQQNQYDPGSLSTYQGLQGGLGSMLNSYMNNPFGNPFFQTQQQLGTSQAHNMGQTAMSGLQQNQNASGMGGGATNPAALEMQQNQARANTGLQAGLGFLAPVQNAQQMQQYAGGLASQYRPLQTGQNQTQSTGGLGTWLPQVAGMALGGLTGGPGAGLFGQGLTGAAGMGPQYGASGMSNANNNLLSGNLGSGFAGTTPGSLLGSPGGGAPPAAPGGSGPGSLGFGSGVLW
jgi:hypothetical protein